MLLHSPTISLYTSQLSAKYLFVISAFSTLRAFAFLLILRILATFNKDPILPLNILTSIAILYPLKRLFYDLCI